MDLRTQVRLAEQKLRAAGKDEEAKRLWVLFYKHQAWKAKRAILIKEGQDLYEEWSDMQITLHQADFVLKMEEELG